MGTLQGERDLFGGLVNRFKEILANGCWLRLMGRFRGKKKFFFQTLPTRDNFFKQHTHFETLAKNLLTKHLTEI